MNDVKLLYNPAKQGSPMRVACFMSGSGTNAIELIKRRSHYEIVVIFTDTPGSKAVEIGMDYNTPVLVRDIELFYKKKGKKKSDFIKNPELDAGTREEFDSGTVKAIRHFNPHIIALAGYMSAVSSPIINSFPGVNVHPAPLSVMENGKRKYTGGNAVRDQILAGEKELYSTIHIVREKVDYGEILMQSRPLQVKLPKSLEEIKQDEKLLDAVVKEHQGRLKEIGDWEIFPLTLQMIAQGRFAIDEAGSVYVDGRLMPNGYRLGDNGA